MNWIPLFKESEINRKRILEAVLTIEKLILSNKNKQPGLHVGDSGISLFYAYLNSAVNNSSYLKTSKKLMDESLRSMSDSVLEGSYCGGIAGICWAYNHLIENGFVKRKYDDKIGEEINEFLIKYSLYSFRRGDNDFLHGGIGASLQLLDLSHFSYVRQGIEDIIKCLEKTAHFDKDGISWSELSDSNKTSYNLGLSHGIPAIIVFLSKVYKKKISQKATYDLLSKSIDWILEKQNYSDHPSCFPSIFVSQSEKHSSRLGWCYGDLGIANALWQAGEVANNILWKQESIKLMKHASNRRNLEQNLIFDASFCHGSSGVAHIFNRFYQSTLIGEFKEAAIFWHMETLKFNLSTKFKVFRRKIDGSESWVSEHGLIDGLAGIGLSLLSSITETEPKWDKCFLLS